MSDPIPKGAVDGIVVPSTVWRCPYGHPNGEIALVVTDVDARRAIPVIKSALADWVRNLPQYDEAASTQTTNEWPCQVAAVALRQDDSSVGVIAFGRETAPIDDRFAVDGSGLDWQLMRTVARALARHLAQAGMKGATIRRPPPAKRFVKPWTRGAVELIGFQDPVTVRMAPGAAHFTPAVEIAEAIASWASSDEPILFGVGQLALPIQPGDLADTIHLAMEYAASSITVTTRGVGKAARVADYSYGQLIGRVPARGVTATTTSASVVGSS